MRGHFRVSMLRNGKFGLPFTAPPANPLGGKTGARCLA